MNAVKHCACVVVSPWPSGPHSVEQELETSTAGLKQFCTDAWSILHPQACIEDKLFGSEHAEFCSFFLSWFAKKMFSIRTAANFVAFRHLKAFEPQQTRPTKQF